MTSFNIYEYATQRQIDNFKPTFLYIKRHTVTGLMYFGKTIKIGSKFVTYLGSGKHWVSHINNHGTEFVENIWYCYFTDIYSLVETAVNLSKNMDILSSEMFLNLKEETGLDGSFSPITELTKLKLSIAGKGKKKPKRTEEHIENWKKTNIGKSRRGSGPKGKSYYTNGLIEVLSTTPMDGFEKGRLKRKFYTNGVIERMFLITDDIPTGFTLGRLIRHDSCRI